MGAGIVYPVRLKFRSRTAARMAFLLRRSPSARWLTPEWQAQMARIDDCLECRQCAERCPYDLDTPVLLKKMLQDYTVFLQQSSSS